MNLISSSHSCPLFLQTCPTVLSVSPWASPWDCEPWSSVTGPGSKSRSQRTRSRSERTSTRKRPFTRGWETFQSRSGYTYAFFPFNLFNVEICGNEWIINNNSIYCLGVHFRLGLYIPGFFCLPHGRPRCASFLFLLLGTFYFFLLLMFVSVLNWDSNF